MKEFIMHFHYEIDCLQWMESICIMLLWVGERCEIIKIVEIYKCIPGIYNSGGGQNLNKIRIQFISLL